MADPTERRALWEPEEVADRAVREDSVWPEALMGEQERSRLQIEQLRIESV